MAYYVMSSHTHFVCWNAEVLCYCLFKLHTTKVYISITTDCELLNAWKLCFILHQWKSSPETILSIEPSTFWSGDQRLPNGPQWLRKTLKRRKKISAHHHSPLHPRDPGNGNTHRNNKYTARIHCQRSGTQNMLQKQRYSALWFLSKRPITADFDKFSNVIFKSYRCS